MLIKLRKSLRPPTSSTFSPRSLEFVELTLVRTRFGNHECGLSSSLTWGRESRPPFIFCIHMPCESIFWFRIPKHLWCHSTLELLRLWKLRGKDESIKTTLVDEDCLALVVRTRALNQHCGFILFVNVVIQSSSWEHIPKHHCHILTHEPRFIVYHHCHHFTEALIPIMGLISLQYTERTWNGLETEVERTCRVLVLLESEFVPNGGGGRVAFISCCKITHLFPLNHSNFRIFLLRFVKQVLNCWISAF